MPSTSGALARRAGGQVRLRIEDHDRERSRPEYEASILDDLEWLGFIPDVPAIAAFRAGPCEGRQSDHPHRYDEALARLERDGRVYGCDCSRADILRRTTGSAPAAPRGALAGARAGAAFGRGGNGGAALRRILQYAWAPARSRRRHAGASGSRRRDLRGRDAGMATAGASGAMRRPAGARSARLLDLPVRRHGRRLRRGHHRRHPRPRPSSVDRSPDSAGTPARQIRSPDVLASPVDRRRRRREAEQVQARYRPARATRRRAYSRRRDRTRRGRGRVLNRQSAICNLQCKIPP